MFDFVTLALPIRGQHEFRGLQNGKEGKDCTLTGTVGSLRARVQPTRAVVFGSLPKYAHGHNALDLNRAGLLLALERLSDTTGLNWHAANLGTFEIGGAVQVPVPPVCITHGRFSNQRQRKETHCQYATGFDSRHGSGHRKAYQKRPELETTLSPGALAQLAQACPAVLDWHLLRLEIRRCANLAGFIPGTPRPFIGEIITGPVYPALVRRWVSEFGYLEPFVPPAPELFPALNQNELERLAFLCHHPTPQQAANNSAPCSERTRYRRQAEYQKLETTREAVAQNLKRTLAECLAEKALWLLGVI